MIMSILRLILLILSAWGYIRLVSAKLAPELSIGFVFASIGSLMSLAGVFNILPHAAAALLVGGLFCLARSVRIDGRWRALTLGGVFFLAMCAVLTARLWGEKLIHYDNFSHWGMIVRHMLAKDRLPNFSDKYILFQSYPPGAASFIYYCARVTGIRAEWFQMLAHWVFGAGMLAGLFCLAKDIPAKLMIFAGGMLLLCADNNFNQLLVDSALAFVALDAAVFCVRYRRELREKILYLTPWLTYLIALKNSGALFVVFAAALALALGGGRRTLIAAAPAAGLWLIWNRHVAYVFEQGLMAQHSMSIDYFKQMLGAKRAGSVETIVSGMLGRVFSLSNQYLPVLAFSALAFILVSVWLRRDRVVRGLLIYGAVCYAVYQAGTLAMYIFTMPERQAVQLASYPRYHGTIWIFAAGLVLMAAALLSPRLAALKRGRLRSIACCALCVAVMAASGMPKITHYTRYLDPESRDKLPIREQVDAMIADYDLPAGSSYYVLVGNDFAATPYLSNAFNCLLLADDVQVRRLNQLFNEAEADGSAYVIAFEDTPEVMDYVEGRFGARERVIRRDEN